MTQITRYLFVLFAAGTAWSATAFAQQSGDNLIPMCDLPCDDLGCDSIGCDGMPYEEIGCDGCDSYGFALPKLRGRGWLNWDGGKGWLKWDGWRMPRRDCRSCCVDAHYRMKESSTANRLRCYLKWHEHKKLLHHECPPTCHPHFGYYETSWRPSAPCHIPPFCPEGDVITPPPSPSGTPLEWQDHASGYPFEQPFSLPKQPSIPPSALPMPDLP